MIQCLFVHMGVHVLMQWVTETQLVPVRPKQLRLVCPMLHWSGSKLLFLQPLNGQSLCLSGQRWQHWPYMVFTPETESFWHYSIYIEKQNKKHYQVNVSNMQYLARVYSFWTGSKFIITTKLNVLYYSFVQKMCSSAIKCNLDLSVFKFNTFYPINKIIIALI